MPEKEFEIYLSLLGRLLRLSPAQKAAISDEFRDHMEERLSDLLQSGLSRDEAIQKAMEEFGDVTGLALDLTRVSKTPIRKIVVRSTVAASVSAAIIMVCFNLFAPPHRVVAPLVAQAQQEQPAKATVPAAIPAAEPKKRQVPQSPTGLNDAELFPEFLTKTIDVNFYETPLTEVCSFLEDSLQVPIQLHQQALIDEQIPIDTPVSLVLNGLSLEEVLHHLARSLYVTWQVDGNLVRITTTDRVRYLTRHFDLSKLVKAGHSLNGLKEILRLAGDDWQDDGSGQGTMALIGESLVVRQTFLNQRRLARLLAAIEQAQPMTALDVCTNREHLLEAIQRPASVEFDDNPLAEVIAFLSDTHQVQILLDTPALSAEEIPSDKLITLSIKSRPLGKLLDQILNDFGATWQIRHGVILITTRDRAEQDTTWIAYNVRDLAPDWNLLTQLADAIEQTTNGQWEEVDGVGGRMAITDTNGMLMVKQTDQAHFEIQTLLERLRQSHSEHAADPGAQPSHQKLIVKNYRMPRDVAVDLQSSLKQLVAPSSWATPPNGDVPTLQLITIQPMMDQVDGVVTGGSHEIRVLNQQSEKQQPGGRPVNANPASVQSQVVRPRSALVIRQTPEVHRQIQHFLQDLGIAVEIGDIKPEGRSHTRGGEGGGGVSGGGGGFF
jgi:hypothetical protein